MTERSRSFLETKYPDGVVVMGGMGVNVSSPLAVAEIVKTGNIGTLSQTAAGVLLARELQDGDPTGMYRKVLEGENGFSNQDMWLQVKQKFYLEDGVRPKKQLLRYRPVERYRNAENKEVEMLTVMGSYALVAISQVLAGDHTWNDSGDIGTNGLIKIPRPLPAAAYGDQLARSRFSAHGAGRARRPNGENV